MVDTCGKSIRALPLRVAAEFGTLIDELLSETLGTPLATSSARRILPDWHRVCQAEEIMCARCDEALSLPDLAATVGVQPAQPATGPSGGLRPAPAHCAEPHPSGSGPGPAARRPPR